MSDYIEVDITTLEQDVRELEETLALVRNDMKSMFETVNELDTMWDGLANEAFNRQFAADRNLFEELCDAVNDIIDSMGNAKNAYRKCEAAVKEEIDKITV